MGRSYLFECSKCGYRAKVSGGADRGFDFHVQTVLCLDCKALYDAVVRLKIPDAETCMAVFSHQRPLLHWQVPDGAPAFESVLNRLPLPARQVAWLHFRIRCPISPIHQVRPWNEPDKCPRCGVYLERNALPFRIWE